MRVRPEWWHRWAYRGRLVACNSPAYSHCVLGLAVGEMVRTYHNCLTGTQPVTPRLTAPRARNHYFGSRTLALGLPRLEETLEFGLVTNGRQVGVAGNPFYVSETLFERSFQHGERLGLHVQPPVSARCIVESACVVGAHGNRHFELLGRVIAFSLLRVATGEQDARPNILRNHIELLFENAIEPSHELKHGFVVAECGYRIHVGDADIVIVPSHIKGALGQIGRFL